MPNIYDEYEPYYSRNINPACGLKPIIYDPKTRKVINKNDTFAFGIVMKRKYAQTFISKGTIKFGCPEEWIKEAKKHGPGKGDIQEGVFAAYNINDENGVLNGLRDNPGSYYIRLVSKNSDQIYLVDKKVIKLPTLCFYTIKAGDFEIVRYGSSEYTAHLHIPARYFRGLNDNKSWKDSEKDEWNEQRVFVLICDHQIFMNRLFKALLKEGIEPSEIICKPINYKNMDIPFEKDVEHPYELFNKNKQFSDQKEGRVVLNIQKESLRNRFLEKTLDIGPLNDICSLHDKYPAGGIELFMSLDGK